MHSQNTERSRVATVLGRGLARARSSLMAGVVTHDPTNISGEYLPGITRNPPPLPTPGTWRWVANWIFIAGLVSFPLWLALAVIWLHQ